MTKVLSQESPHMASDVAARDLVDTVVSQSRAVVRTATAYGHAANLQWHRAVTQLQQWQQVLGEHPWLRGAHAIEAILHHVDYLQSFADQQYPPYSAERSYARIAIEQWKQESLRDPRNAQPFGPDAVQAQVEQAQYKERSERAEQYPVAWHKPAWTIRHCAGEPLTIGGESNEYIKRLRYTKTKTGIDYNFHLASMTETTGERELVDIDHIDGHQECAYLTNEDTGDTWFPLPTSLGSDALPKIIYQAATGVEEIRWDKEAGQFYAKVYDHADQVSVRMYLREQVELRTPLTPAEFTTEWAAHFSEEDFHPESWALYESFEQHRDKLSLGALANLRAQKLQWREYHWHAKAARAALLTMGSGALKHFHDPPIEAANCVSSSLEQGALELAFGARKLRTVEGWLGAKCKGAYHCALVDGLRHFWTEQWDGKYWTHDVNWVPPQSEELAQAAQRKIDEPEQPFMHEAERVVSHIGHVQFMKSAPQADIKALTDAVTLTRFGRRYQQLGEPVASAALQRSAIVPVVAQDRQQRDVTLLVQHNGNAVYLPTTRRVRGETGYGVPVPQDPRDTLRWDAQQGMFILQPGSAVARQSRVSWNPELKLPTINTNTKVDGRARPYQVSAAMRPVFGAINKNKDRYYDLWMPLSPRLQLEIAWYEQLRKSGPMVKSAPQELESWMLPGCDAVLAIFAGVQDAAILQSLDCPMTQFALDAQRYGHEVYLATGTHIFLHAQGVKRPAHIWPEIKYDDPRAQHNRWHAIGSDTSHDIAALASLVMEPKVYAPHHKALRKLRTLSSANDAAAINVLRTLLRSNAEQPEIALPNLWHLGNVSSFKRRLYSDSRHSHSLSDHALEVSLLGVQQVDEPLQLQGQLGAGGVGKAQEIVFAPDDAQRSVPLYDLHKPPIQAGQRVQWSWNARDPLRNSSGHEVSARELVRENLWRRVDVGDAAEHIYYSSSLDLALRASRIAHYRPGDSRVMLRESASGPMYLAQWKYRSGGPSNRLLITDIAERRGEYVGHNVVWEALAEYALRFVPAKSDPGILRAPRNADEAALLQELYAGLKQTGDSTELWRYDMMKAITGLVGAISVVMHIDQEGMRPNTCSERFDIAGLKTPQPCATQSMQDDWEHQELKHMLASMAQTTQYTAVGSLHPRWWKLFELVAETWKIEGRPHISISLTPISL